jgi:hypothetical protein
MSLLAPSFGAALVWDGSARRVLFLGDLNQFVQFSSIQPNTSASRAIINLNALSLNND